MANQSLEALNGPGWHLEVDPEGEQERLDHFITRRIPRLSRSRAAKLETWLLDPNTGQLLQILKKSKRLQTGMLLWVKRPLSQDDSLPSEQPLILDEDQDFVVLYKPSGWLTHPTASCYQSTLTTWLKVNGIKACPAHRLDRETSGLILCAKSSQVSGQLQQLFTSQRIKKTYLAIVMDRSNTPLSLTKGENWTNTQSLGFDLQSNINIKMGKGSHQAHTSFEIIDIFPRHHIVKRLNAIHHPNSKTRQIHKLMLIRAHPHTGRQHQIRVHLAMNQVPILGDKLYGLDESYFLKHLNHCLSEEDLHHLGHPRQALHAESLTFSWQGMHKSWTCPFPSDLGVLLPKNCFFS